MQRFKIPNDHTVNYCSVSASDFKALDPTLMCLNQYYLSHVVFETFVIHVPKVHYSSQPVFVQLFIENMLE